MTLKHFNELGRMKTHLFLFFYLFSISSVIHAQSEIFAIARNGCAEDLQEVLKHHPEAINARNSSGYSPLTLACYNGNLEVAAILAKQVENININSDSGTPLMAAVFKNDLKMTQMLLDLDADPNIADPNKVTALHYAVQFIRNDLIRLLMSYGADISLKDNKGLSPWDYAIQQDNQSILTLLKN